VFFSIFSADGFQSADYLMHLQSILACAFDNCYAIAHFNDRFTFYSNTWRITSLRYNLFSFVANPPNDSKSKNSGAATISPLIKIKNKENGLRPIF
jgi:hypothetical protein